MDTRYPTSDELYDPPAAHRFKVEAAMLEMIERLQQEGLAKQEIALILADAADDYVIRLANMIDPDTPEDKHTVQQRH
jgi:hypothetical protein